MLSFPRPHVRGLKIFEGPKGRITHLAKGRGHSRSTTSYTRPYITNPMHERMATGIEGRSAAHTLSKQSNVCVNVHLGSTVLLA